VIFIAGTDCVRAVHIQLYEHQKSIDALHALNQR